VVALVAEGLTNPEVGQRLFVSRRTVQTHLSSAFRKLEITSRVELAALVERRGQASPELGGSR
jgi:DNA-binding NarL/FixJ family response regulator